MFIVPLCCVCVRARKRKCIKLREELYSMFPVVENIFLSTTMYQNMCLYSSVKKKNVTVIYPGSRFLKKNCPFLVLLICMNVPFVAIMSIKLQITAQRSILGSPLGFLPATDFKEHYDLELMLLKNKVLEADKVIK